MVANYSDILREKDFQRFSEFMADRAEEFIPNQHVWLLSALDELCRLQGEERPNQKLSETLESNFTAFRNTLINYIEAKESVILPNRICRMVQSMRGAISKEIEMIESGLNADAQEVARFKARIDETIQSKSKEQSAIQHELKDGVTAMRIQSEEWIGELLDRMSAELKTLSDMSEEDIKKYYSIFCIDTIQNALESSLNYHVDMIYSFLEENCSKFAANITLPTGNYGFRFNLDNKSWTKGDNVGYVLSKIPQLGLLSLVADGVAGAMRKRETAADVPELLNSIRAQYANFRSSAMEAIKDTYKKIYENALTNMTAYFQKQQVEENDLNEQFMRSVRQTDEKKEQIHIALEALKRLIEQFNQIIPL